MIKKPERYIKAYSFPDNVKVDFSTIDDPMASIRKSFFTQIVDMADQSIVDAVVKFAQAEGVTDLYLLDKKFVMEAIQEKLERMQGDI